ncbi:hypothetical protein CBR_g22059 [Chara braunii]|uniref:Integrase catalytic domain-containing protein n=1 Tax=Chara braunii TaxID=69332 RepID=A0A388L1Y9_CHABU|nr:hypothetical protein CBR_g22059 [Chara braunii]|eukprot:GBG76311.1 hypothetical protein CBR_g22059 [Chara braunii]
MDVTGPFPRDRHGHDGILTVVDRLSKYARFLPCKYHAAAPELARLLHTGWITNQGVPEDIVSDRDTRFMSTFWTSLMTESGTTMKSSSARHPQTDGQMERARQTTQMMLRTLIRPDQKDWVDRLPDIEFAYNTSVHPAICVTPFELHHGGEKARIKARANMQKAQIRMQQQANRRRLPCPFREGDLVWVLSEEFALEQDVSCKLLPKWFGPWEVTSAVGDDPTGPSFVINIPPHLTVHRVFHASKLAIYTPPSDDEFPGRRSQDPPSMDGHQEVVRVITHRKYGNKPIQYKVTFKQCAPDDTRWISSTDLQTSAPLIFADYEKRRLAKDAALLGALYNACDDWFAGETLFEMLKPKYVKLEDCPVTHLQLSFEESYTGRFKKLYVQPELQLSILGGLVRLAEYGKFLADEGCASIILHVRTKRQTVDMDHKRLRKYVSARILKSTDATHFVSGIIWGANTFMSFGERHRDEATKSWIRGQIEQQFHNTMMSLDQKTRPTSGDAMGGASDNTQSAPQEGAGGVLTRSGFKVYGDVYTDSVTRGESYTLLEACELVQRTREVVLKLNEGRGQPIIYILSPLSDMFDRLGMAPDSPKVFRPLEDKSVSSITAFFDELLLAKQRLVHFLESASDLPMLDTLGVRDRKRLVDIAERGMRHRLGKSLVAVRSGKDDGKAVIDLLGELRSNKDLSPESIRKFIDRNMEKLEQYRSEMEEREKMAWVKELGSKGVRYLWVGGGNNEDVSAKLMQELSTVEMADVLFFTDVEVSRSDERCRKNRQLFEKIVTDHNNSLIASAAPAAAGEADSDEVAAADKGNQSECRNMFYLVEYEVLPMDIPRSAIHRYAGGKRVSVDLLDDYSWFISQNLVTLFEGRHEKGFPIPHFSVDVKCQCPGALHASCPAEPRQWQCIACRVFILYGRDNYYYCRCGRAPVDKFRFKCNNPKHSVGGGGGRTRTFLAFTPEDDLPKMMRAMAGELEEINILLLGETGVGKSTFINAFANYLSYGSLQEAEKDELVILIPTSFTLIDENYEERTVNVEPNFGGADNREGDGLAGGEGGTSTASSKESGAASLTDEAKANETLQAGASATQACKAYVFPFADKIVRLIDTPGIGDTRGIDQDKKNFDNILAFLGFHRDIHGICILLKPNNARLSVFFRYCIQQLMFHLHKNASQNIVFLFTNARSTFYRPGDTLPALKKLLNDIKVEPPHVDIPFNHSSTFCLDNESFRFMVALRNGINFTDDDKKNFNVSWNTSVSECKRLMDHVATRKPHAVKDTISVNDARRLIALLSQPIGDITQVIQESLTRLEVERTKFESNSQDILDLQQDLFIPVVKVEYAKLPAPRTVCTSPQCRNAIARPPNPAAALPGKGGGEVAEDTKWKPNFITYAVCCSPCWLATMSGVSLWDYLSQKAPVGLRLCTAFHKISGACKVCGCNWKTHAHQFTEARQTVHKVKNTTIDGKIKTKEELREALEGHLNTLRQRIVELEQEQQSINGIVAKFAHFCSENAISPYNDAYKDYLDYLIKVKEAQSGSTDATAQGLKKAKKEYEKNLTVLKQAMEEHKAGVVSPNEISLMVRDLYRLKHNGSMIEQAVNEYKMATDAMHVTYSEVVYSKGRRLIRSQGEGPASADALQGMVDGMQLQS